MVININTRITLNEFKEALISLDNKLNRVSSGTLPLRVKAIGGFALLYHSIRESGYTADIDSVTQDYNDEIIKCITEVATEFGFQDDWINNYNVFENDIESIEMLINPFWERIAWKFKNIDFWVADLETLFRAKMLAAEDDFTTGRAQDFPDLVDIMKKFNMNSLGHVINYCVSIDIDLKSEYPRNYKRIQNIFKS